MVLTRIYCIYFSATLTTEKTVKYIATEIIDRYRADQAAKGIGRQAGKLKVHQIMTESATARRVEGGRSRNELVEILNYNFAYPENRKSFPKLGPTDIVVFGMPTYAGRLPNLMLSYLETIEGNGAMAIPVVTFGNRAYENSLLELRNILEEHDFHTFAAGAFSCEHSFSRTLAAGRPDRRDEKEIKEFADKAYDKLRDAFLKKSEELDGMATFSDLPEDVFKKLSPVYVPGDLNDGYFQPKDGEKKNIDIRKVTPLTNEKCNECGLCAIICPMGAIDPENVTEIKGKCIKCNACVKRCFRGAKYFADEGYLFHKNSLEENYGKIRGENESFL